ncbi:amino acid adenylation domain-containing protein [Methylomonas sp. HW2-6]|uniref:amino acid adenylation domain-containing protein n=1 Tax=Methylomonas sp. HW2-6 TaxID=3376687 RepID=UPI00404193E2
MGTDIQFADAYCEAHEAFSVLDRLAQAQPDLRRRILIDFIRGLLVEFLELDDPDDVADDRNFGELGADSMQAVDFKVELEQRLHCALRSTVLFDYPRLDLLADYLLAEVLDLAAVATDCRPVTVPAALVVRPQPAQAAMAIAVVGMAGIFPEAENAVALWQKVLTGVPLQVSGRSEAPELAYGRIDLGRRHAPEALPISEAEYAALPRQEQLLYRCIADALLEYRLDLAGLANTPTAVFIGCRETAPTADVAYRIPLANKISFRLNLKGPSETVNSFCISVYLALHRAVQSLRAGECRQAIVGGVNLIAADEFAQAARQGLYRDILSRDNQTKSFGATANGYLRSEGGGVLILKPLADAEQDGNRILGVVKGSAVYHGGRGYSFEAPNPQGLKEAIRLSLANAGCSADSIDYVEAHGIGNPMADALELGAVDQSYRQASADSDKRWHVSSVKPSIGHPEAASGMASIIKVLKAFEHSLLPGIAGLDAVNSDLAAGHALILQRQGRPWPSSDQPKRAALNSYAIGGVNAHVVLEEYRADAAVAASGITQRAARASDRPLAELGLDPSSAAVLAELVQDIFKLELGSLDLSLSLIDYGFDSIDVVQFVGRLNESLGLDIKFSQVLGVDDFAGFFALLALKLQQKTPAGSTGSSGETPGLADAAICGPLSEVQKGLWYVNQLAPESIAFNVPLTFKVSGNVDAVLLQQALAAMLAEYPMLTVALEVDAETGACVQRIRPVAACINCHEMRLESAAVLDACLWELLRQPFDLSKDAPVRLYAIDAAESGTYVYFVIHHIVFDGTSGALFIAAFWQKYHALRAGATLVCRAPDLAFLDFVDWERRYLAGADGAADARWWRELLADRAATLNLPYDYLPQASLSAAGIGCQKFRLDGAELAALKRLATRGKTSLAVLFLALFQVFLYKLTRHAAPAVTTPVRGRPKSAYEHSIGCYINVMVVPCQVQPAASFNQLMQQARRRFFECLDHAHYPFPRLLSDLGLHLANPQENPFPVSYTYQNFFDELLHNADALQGVETFYEVFQQTEDNYTLEIYDFRHSLQINIKYKRSLFDDASVVRHLACFKQLMAGVVANPDQAVSAIEILPAAEKQRLLTGFNATQTVAVPAACLHQLFVRQALKTPEQVAVIGEESSLSYRELHQQSDRLAVYLQQLGVQADTLVAVCLRRSPLMLVGLLGVLKAGGAYLPLDANTPTERGKLLLADSGAKLILTEAALESAAGEMTQGLDLPRVAVDRDWPRIAQIDEPPRQLARPEHLAYVIYTSGSSGRPKGVMVEHRNVVNHNLAVIAAYQLSGSDRVLQFSTIGFDIFVEEVFPTLLSGGAVVMMDGERFTDAGYLKSLVQRQRVSLINLPTAYWHTLVEQDFSDTALSRVVIGGEKAEAEKYRVWRQRNPNIRVINSYGPTETTVIATLYPIEAAAADQPIPLGRPLANTQVYVLDSDLQPVPIGVPGELHIAGAGVTRGYLNQPELTAEKFIANPFGPGRLYKTGDLVRWRDDGQLLFIGRQDQQVKIRGFRVELGEIEQALLLHPNIRHAVVVAREFAGGKQLVAYFQAGIALETAELIAYLRQRLPDYMVPAAWVALAQMPLTDNGKVDRKALLALPVERSAEAGYVAPSNAIEATLADIWQDVLGIGRIGIQDNFFALGGHSLLAIQIVLRAKAALGVELALSTLFEAADIQQLAVAIANSGRAPAEDSLANYLKHLEAFVV